MILARWFFLSASIFVATFSGAETVARLDTDFNLSAPVYQELLASQEASLNLKWDDAARILDLAEPKAEGHILVDLFRSASMLSHVQDDLSSGRRDPQVFKAFHQTVDQLIAKAEIQAQAYPKDPYAKLYLGAGYGCRGLAKLYQNQYFSSYLDGRRGASHLKEGVAMDPTIYNAYMGLGQFEYYCGRLSGVLQFFLDLNGDEKKGLQMIGFAIDKGTYAHWPALVYRGKTLATEQRDIEGAIPDLQLIYKRYPNNHHIARVCLEIARDTRAKDLRVRAMALEILRLVDQGWVLPAGVSLPIETARFAVAEALENDKKMSEARPHFQRLLDAKDTAIQAHARAALDAKN